MSAAASVNTATAASSNTERRKAAATLQAQAALAGARLVEIEADDGGSEFVLTLGASTLRFRESSAARSTFGDAMRLRVLQLHRNYVNPFVTQAEIEE